MNAAVLNTQSAPTSAVDAVAAHTGPVIVDFEAIIYLRSSTEDFIDSARPGLLALLIMFVLDAVKPWRWTGGEATRDAWRIRCILLCFPWTKKLWAKRAPLLGLASSNAPLIAAIQKRALTPNGPPTVIVTDGFDFVVAPLIAALGLSRIKLVAARLFAWEDKREGLFRLIVRRIGHESVRRALVLTHSKQDDMLLDSCALPLCVESSQMNVKPALSGHYFPGQYLARLQDKSDRFTAREILGEDFALWVLASIALSSRPFTHAIALLFLLLSFWAVYESGYADRERIAKRSDDKPRDFAVPIVAPWIWASISGGIGVLLLRGMTVDAVLGLGAWIGLLAATFGLFALYNRATAAIRIWWYVGLQLARSAAFVVLVPLHLIGALAVGAHVIAKWLPAFVGDPRDERATRRPYLLARLLFFILLAVLAAATAGLDAILTWSAVALLGWNVFRARHELMDAMTDPRGVERAAANSQRAGTQAVNRKEDASS